MTEQERGPSTMSNLDPRDLLLEFGQWLSGHGIRPQGRSRFDDPDEYIEVVDEFLASLHPAAARPAMKAYTPFRQHEIVSAVVKALIAEGLLDEPSFEQGGDPGGIESRRIYNSDVAKAVVSELERIGVTCATLTGEGAPR